MKHKVENIIRESKLDKKICEVILAELFEISKTELFAKLPKLEISQSLYRKFKLIEKKNLGGLPYQYAIHKADFMGLIFYVDKNVLIPRPESELMVERVLNRLKIYDLRFKSQIDILDVGTGSGCLAVTVAKHLQNRAKVWAVDISRKALVVARKNAKLNNSDVKFLKSDLLKNKKLPKRFDFILTNLPYLRSDYLLSLPREIAAKLKFEPKHALDGGRDGFELIRKLIDQLPHRLKKSGLVIIEIDPSHESKIEELERDFPEFVFAIKKDLNKLSRFIEIKKAEVNQENKEHSN